METAVEVLLLEKATLGHVKFAFLSAVRQLGGNAHDGDRARARAAQPPSAGAVDARARAQHGDQGTVRGERTLPASLGWVTTFSLD